MAGVDALVASALLARDEFGSLSVSAGFAMLGLHAMLAVAGGLAVAQLVDAPRGRRGTFAVAVVVGFFTPVLGTLGLGLTLAAWLDATRPDRELPWERVDPAETLDAPPRLAAHRNVVAGDLIDALTDRTADNAAHRFQVVLQTRHLRPRAAISVLKVALRDPADDVRLFAFSRIEQFRASLEARIKALQAARARESEDPAHVELRLAETHWELAYLGLVEGSVLRHTLDKANAHVENAERLAPEDAPTRFVHARVLLARGETVKASAEFTMAMNLGYPRRRVLPYLAECAFLRRELDVVPRLMREVAATRQDHPFLAHVTDLWT